MGSSKAAKLNVLILSGRGSDVDADELKVILECSPDVELIVQNRILDLFHGTSINNDCPIVISFYDHDVVFIVVDQTPTDRVASLVRYIRREKPKIPVIAVVDRADNECTLNLLAAGVSDIITPPLKQIDVLSRISSAMGMAPQKANPAERLKEKLGLKRIIGESPNFVSEMRKISIVAKYDVSVSISGETGTGKELVARAIHYLSGRSRRPFITLDCAATPADLFENELFGHKRGAFTSATSSEEGLVHAAEGGTLFLDEIDSLSPSSQVKLLRLLQEKEYRPLGSNKVRTADVRIISASNDVLWKAVEEGRFRPELHYRLNIIPIKLPPLRERQGDILLLTRDFVSKFSNLYGKGITDLSPGAVQKLLAYGWPGNVRELENTIERAILFSEESVIRPHDITISASEGLQVETSFRELKAQAIRSFEISYIKSLLELHDGNITRAAMAAKKNRRAFWELIRKYQIDVSKPG